MRCQVQPQYILWSSVSWSLSSTDSSPETKSSRALFDTCNVSPVSSLAISLMYFELINSFILSRNDMQYHHTHQAMHYKENTHNRTIVHHVAKITHLLYCNQCLHLWPPCSHKLMPPSFTPSIHKPHDPWRSRTIHMHDHSHTCTHTMGEYSTFRQCTLCLFWSRVEEMTWLQHQKALVLHSIKVASRTLDYSHMNASHHG